MDIAVDKGQSLNNSPHYDLIVVGKGIAASTLLWDYLNQKENTFKKILQISADDYFPPCSLATTSVVCRDGIKKGISDLGDLLFDSYQKSVQSFETNNFKSVEKGIIKIYPASDILSHKQQKKRYEGETVVNDIFELEAYFINAPHLLQELQTPLVAIKNELVTGLVEDQSGVLVKTHIQNYYGKTVLLCLGFGENHIAQGKSEIKSTSVAGHYLHIKKDLSYLQHSIVHQWQMGAISVRVYFRKNENKMMLGSYNQKNEIMACDYSELKKLYDFVLPFFKDPSLPPFSQWQGEVGIRAKGHKMRPYFGPREGHERIFEIKNLYKNGFSLPFFASSTLIPLINKAQS